jgi:hypothetical protein
MQGRSKKILLLHLKFKVVFITSEIKKEVKKLEEMEIM